MKKTVSKVELNPISIAYVPTSSLIPYARNARLHSEKQVAQIAGSIKEFGFVNPILVDGERGIIAGHGRLAAAQKLGMETVPIVELCHLTKTQARALVLADNRLAEVATWDEEILKVELDDLVAEGFDLDVIGFDELAKESDGAANDVDAEPQIDRADELAKKWGVERGQMWELGDHRIICGDSTDEETVLRVMGNERATLVFTDPPYGVSIGDKNAALDAFEGKTTSGRVKVNIESDTISCDDLYKLLLKCFTLTKKFCSDDCAIFVCSPQGGELGMMMMMMMQDAGLKIRHVLNWAKNCATFSMGRLDYDYQHEPILYTWVKTHKRNKAGAFQTSLWSVDKPRASKEHPTMKPVELPENAILNHTDPGDIVYEPFSGSGTDIIACERTGRRCRAVELMPGYVAVALERWAEATGRTPLLMKG